MTYTTGTLEQIQALSNERQKLWRAKWPRRIRDEYRERIKQLDGQIAALWDVHRAEVAALRLPERPVDREAVFDFTTRVEPSPSHYQVKVGERWQYVDDETVAEAIRLWTVDNIPPPAPKEIPLREVLARRGKTLTFGQDERGRAHAREVALPT